MTAHSRFGGKSLRQLDQRTQQGILSPNANVTGRACTPPIKISRWVRNGKHPNASLESEKAQAGNQAVMYRSKEYFHGTGVFQSTVTTKWRFAFHSGPYAYTANVVAWLAPGSASDPFGRLQITDGTNTLTEDFHTGPTVGFGFLSACRQMTRSMLILPDTDYYATWTDSGTWTVGLCVYEGPSLSGTFGGYLAQNAAVGAPILDAQRQNIAELARAQWRRGGAHLLNWSVDDGTTPIATNSSTGINVVDATTAVSVNSAGFTFDLSGHNRLSQTTGVPVVIKAYGAADGGGSTGKVLLKDSTGATVLSVTIPATGVTGWCSATGLIPASSGKYDLYVTSVDNVTAVNVYAVSIYEYEA